MQKLGIYGLLILVAGCTTVRDENNYYVVDTNPYHTVEYSTPADDSPPTDDSLPSDSASAGNDDVINSIQEVSDQGADTAVLSAVEQ